jgi:hypothetical protein
MAWPNGPDETTTPDAPTTTWRVRTYYKKSCEQHEYFNHSDYNNPLIVKDGFRSAEFYVDTNDGKIPNFEFTETPGGNGAKDSVNLFSCEANNIVGSEMIEMFDGGCWGDIEWPEDMDEDEQERLQEFVDENGSYSLEDEEGWMLDETECWVWGPLEISDEDGNVVAIIEADDEGNVAIKQPKDYE